MLALGEMGRHPQVRHRARTPAATTGTTPSSSSRPAAASRAAPSSAPPTSIGAQVTDKFYKVESFGRTLYHLLGIDPDTIVNTPANRPVKLIAEDAPIIKEAIA